MKLYIKKTKQQNHGKKYFAIALLFLVTLAISNIVFSPPEVKECKKNKELILECACPSDSKYIGQKNIILIDASSPIPLSKLNDVNQITQQLAQSDIGIFNWVFNGKRVDQTSIYVLNKDLPVDMTPVASFCQLPPELALDYFSPFTGAKIQSMKNALFDAVNTASSGIRDFASAKTSEIVKAVATVTSNSSTWKNGSTFILVSDLYENSSTCGWFEKEGVPNLNNISLTCKHQVETISQYMSSDKTTVAICTIHSKDMKIGLKDFWDQVFYSANGFKPRYTCDPIEIASRSEFIRNN